MISREAADVTGGLFSLWPGSDDRSAKAAQLLHQRAEVYVSESGSKARGDFGRRILTEMWRVERLATSIEARDKSGQLSFHTLVVA
jgi:hypothetical protein